MVTKVSHIGIVVNDLTRAVEKFQGFGLPCTEIKEDKEIGVRAGFLSAGDTNIEIICLTEASSKNDPMMELVRKEKGAINHICLQVDDIESSIRDFESKGAKLVEGCPRVGAHGRIAFFYPETTENVLIEICQV
jgi:methylmalonyl-CoA/ethylmalonyl-CoA epimerase